MSISDSKYNSGQQLPWFTDGYMENAKEKCPDSIHPDNKWQGQAKDMSTDFTAGAFTDTLMWWLFLLA